MFIASLIAATLLTARAAADQQYDVRGTDVYRVGTAGLVSRVQYVGTQLLTVAHRDGRKRYDAQARYRRNADDGNSTLGAHFVQELLPNGSFEDRVDEDPDFLTVLNQPFAVQLDAVTLADLRNLHGQVPFSATSPLGGQTVLRGFLRPGVSGKIGGRSTVAVRFEAQGPMTAPLPERGKATMSGNMRMDGTAYYSLDDAMLLALDATLTIVAQLHDGGASTPVRIVYGRTIRASSGAAPAKTKPSTEPPEEPKKPQPTPLATGGEMAFRPTPSTA